MSYLCLKPPSAFPSHSTKIQSLCHSLQNSAWLSFSHRYFLSFPFFFFFLGPYSWRMDVLRLKVKQELQLLAYITATATQDLNSVCDLHHRSRQCWIPDPLSKARDRTHAHQSDSFPLHCNGNSWHFLPYLTLIQQ